MGQDHGTARNRPVRAGHDLAGQVDSRDQLIDPGDLAVNPCRETVLVVDARPGDPDLNVTRRQIAFGELPHASRDTIAGLLGDERPEGGRNGAHDSMLLRLADRGVRRAMMRDSERLDDHQIDQQDDPDQADRRDPDRST